MTTPKKTKRQRRDRSLDSSSSETKSTPTDSPFAKMTSRAYLRLNEGESDPVIVKSYIESNDESTRKEIKCQQIQATGNADAVGLRQAIDRADQIYHELVWDKRRELVLEMNRATLDSLATHYGITPGAECIRNHPDAGDLDKGLVLERLRQFLEWDGEYHGIAPEMLRTNVEAALEAAKTRTKGWQLSDTEMLESVLHRASACKKANANMLFQALKECIAVKCACPSIERGLALRSNDLEEQIQDLEKEIKELGDFEDDEDSKDKDDLKKVKTAHKDMHKRHGVIANLLRDVCAYREEFTPDKAMPDRVRDVTDKWFTAQFTKGKPVGSIVRVAWLADVFHSFWEQHQSAYLASDPSQSEMQKKALAYGKRGAAKKVDEKWRKFTSLFAQYFGRTVSPDGKLSLEERQALVDDFGHHLLEQRTKGATDKRSVANIKDFVSTLLTLMDRNVDEDLIQSTWQELRTGRDDQRKEKASGDFFYGAAETNLKRADRTGAQIPQPFAEDLTVHAGGKLRGKAGQFRRTTFSSLELETFKTCLEIVRAASHCKDSSSGRRGNRRGGAKKVSST